MNRVPGLFQDRQRRRIVLDKERLKNFVTQSDVPLGVTAETPYSLFIVDLVESTDGHRVIAYPYQRVVYKAQLCGATNVVVIGRLANEELGEIGSIILVRQERHATGRFHLELPRGFGEVGLSGLRSALHELKSETGFDGNTAFRKGSTYTDSGLTDARVDFYEVPVIRRTEPDPDCGEVIQEVQLLAESELVSKVRAGSITDSFTVQAVALLGLALA
ncbi:MULTISPECIES: NUDIX hydrolase [Streptomyces]|uniref:NUDIX hydrolase n=1 Tax=Streptomyces griseosporeus TaxID=1910 RepID=A0ABV3KQY2_STRGS|nr:NUDIX hydrolase [Streptomyces actuosus]MBM4821024.1 NUDIX hydrolase [Streptomyces actuosus]